jgi:N4-bis(aminopropyl)spermidine synthase
VAINKHGFFVSRMQRKLHQYHLDDDPDLRSCNLFVTSLPGQLPLTAASQPIAPERLENFYGMSQPPKVRYVRERKKPDYGKARDEEYFVEFLGDHKP